MTRARGPDDDTRPLDDTDVGAPTLDAEAEPETGSPPARYALGPVIGSGGMGEVVACQDLELRRDVALKRLRADRSPGPEALGRFVREARVQARLDHPAIVPVHELRSDAGRPYFTMKRVRGVTLSRVLQRRAEGDEEYVAAFGVHRLLSAFGRVCEAVAYAHDQGVIHRDLKPGNVMIADFGAVYVIDWGIAKVAGDTADLDWLPATPAPPPDGDLTLQGARMGTEGYVAPELVLSGARAADEQTDVYALGIILAEVLTGTRTRPLLARGQSIAEVLAERAPDCAPELVAISARAAAPDRADRYASVRELLDDLERFQHGDRDLELRRQLSGRHADLALRAFEDSTRGELDRTREAMRQVGRALALDPDNGAAMRLLVRLLGHVPREVPPEVARGLEDKGRASVASAGRVAALLYLAVLAFLPLAFLVGVEDHGALAAVGGFALVAVVCNGVEWPRQHTWTSPIRFPGFVSSTVLVASVATAFGPLILVPAFLAVNTMGHVSTWYHGKSHQALLVAAPAIIVPFALQKLGWAPPTLLFGASGMTVTPWALDTTNPAAEWLLLAGSLVLLVGSVVVAAQVRANLDRSLHRGALQSWQLQQMLPEGAFEAEAPAIDGSRAPNGLRA